jgi:galactofuranose transport system substrate-binding protein
MRLLKWLGGAAVGLGLVIVGSPAFAITIGFSQVGDEGDWRPAFSKDMQEEAKKEGIDLKFTDAQGKEEEQLKAVRSFIAQKVDAIIIAPVVVTGWDQVLAEAKKAGIPVFLADRDVDTADKSLFVTRISADFNPLVNFLSRKLSDAFWREGMDESQRCSEALRELRSVRGGLLGMR